MKCIVDDDVVLSRPLKGPLSAHIAGFAQWARDQGYARATRYRQVLLAACFSRWLGQHSISVRRVAAEHLVRYLRSRARRIQIHRGDCAALRQFLDFLCYERVIRSQSVAAHRRSAVEQAAQTFETYLRNERVLAEPTITYYVTFVREFLTDRFGRGRVTLTHLRAPDVVRFVRRQASRLHLKRAKQLTTALRAFLQYARYRGDIIGDLEPPFPPSRIGRCRQSRVRFPQSRSIGCSRPSIDRPPGDVAITRSCCYSRVWDCGRAKWRFSSWTI